jgi:hypothetical protein
MGRDRSALWPAWKIDVKSERLDRVDPGREWPLDKEEVMGRARRSLAMVAIAGLALFAATTAAAAGPPIVNETEHFANEPDVFVDVNPCDPSQEVEVTSSDTGVIHFSLFADGTVHITGTVRSTFSVDVLPTDGTPDATGRGVTWFGTNGKIDPDTGEAFGKGESTFTTSVHVTFTDGTRISFHEVAHVLFDANGVVKVEFDKFKAHCG